MIIQVKIFFGDFNFVGLIGECFVQYVLKGLRYVWYIKFCEFKKCVVYSIENEFLGFLFMWNVLVN